MGTVPNAGFSAKDFDSLRKLFERTGGKAWEPPTPNYPWIVKMIEAGYLRRCDMRCGFEAFKDAGLTFTDAGRRMLALYEALEEAADALRILAETAEEISLEGAPMIRERENAARAALSLASDREGV